MLKDVIYNFFEFFSQFNINELNHILDDDCLFLNTNQNAVLSKEKVIKSLKDIHEQFNIKKITILNCVQDSEDTLLVAYSIMSHLPTPIFGSSVIRLNNHQITYIKNFIVH